jgi:hypothetical protein
MPTADDPPGVWQAWVAQAGDQDARYKRLAQVPDDLRPTVRLHLKTMDAIEAYHRRTRRR